MEDCDGDGTAAPLLEEPRGLEGTGATPGIRYGKDGEHDAAADVYTANGLRLRDPDGGPAPWDVEAHGADGREHDVVDVRGDD